MTESVVPVLRCADVDVAVEWYSTLGFEEAWRHQFEPHLPRFVAVRRGPLQLFLSEHEGDAPLESLVWLRLDDFAEIVERLGATPVEQAWGPELRVTDPDGNRLRIGPPPAT